MLQSRDILQNITYTSINIHTIHHRDSSANGMFSLFLRTNIPLMKSKYSCIVIDDNLIEQDVAAMFLRKISTLEVVAVCSNALEAMDILAKKDIDIVFSDVRMPDISGIGLKKSLQHAPIFVFISGHPDHAVDSFDVDAIDFVVKPVSFDRLLKAANKAIGYYNLKRQSAQAGVKQAEAAQADFASVDAQDYFFIKENDGFKRILASDVLYIESMGDFSKITVISLKYHVILVSLKSLEKQLPAHLFLRVHKQYIVNIPHIISITANDLLLTAKKTVPVSTNYRQLLLEKVVAGKLLTR